MTTLEALLAVFDARSTITTTYGNAAHLIRRALTHDTKETAMNPDNPERGDGLAILVILGFLAAAVLGVGFEVGWNNTHTTQVCHVKNKEAVANSNGGHTYRVYTRECGVLDVSDAFWQGKFNSADTYASIDAGKAYTFETIGWRNGFFSLMPNIIDATATK